MATLRIRSTELEWREIEGEVVAVDLEKSTYLGLNETGTVLWAALAQGATLDELAARLQEEFEVDHATAVADVASFVDALRAEGLLDE